MLEVAAEGHGDDASSSSTYAEKTPTFYIQLVVKKKNWPMGQFCRPVTVYLESSTAVQNVQSLYSVTVSLLRL